jgi:DNA repair exonuclease SbcCD ATPase subunit
MIKFHSISYKNFLSTGDQGNMINLDKTLTTIVVGRNGDGKSTFIDALVYGLFGKPFRKVKLGQLINNVNEKGLYVSVVFSVGNKTYTVNRGMKPSKFEIYVNGELIPQPASNADYQHILENDILKLNYKSFTQIIILGSASYKPFMQLKLGDRREIIENLLDISIFSDMNTLLKAGVKELKSDIVDVKHKLELVKDRYKTKREYFQEAVEKRNKRIDDLEETIQDVSERNRLRHMDKDGFEESIEYIKEQIKEFEKTEESIRHTNVYISNKESALRVLTEEIDVSEEMNNKIHSLKDEIVDLKTAINEYESNIIELISEQDELIKERDNIPSIDKRDGLKEEIAILKANIFQSKEKLNFYDKNDTCPECGQDIGNTFADTVRESLNVDIKTYEDSINSAIVELEDIESNIVLLQKINDKLSTIDKSLMSVKMIKNNTITSITEKKTALDKLIFTSDEVLDDMKKEQEKYNIDIK